MSILKQIAKLIQPSHNFKNGCTTNILIIDGCSTIFGLQLIHYLLTNFPNIAIYNIGMSNDATFNTMPQYRFINCNLIQDIDVWKTLRRLWWRRFHILINNTQFGLNRDESIKEDIDLEFFNKNEMENCLYGNVINVLRIIKFFINRNGSRNSTAYQIINVVNNPGRSSKEKLQDLKVEYFVSKRAIRQVHESLLTETEFPNRVLLVEVPISSTLEKNQKFVKRFVKLMEEGAMGEYVMTDQTFIQECTRKLNRKEILSEMQDILNEWR